MKSLGRHLSFANVVACLALFVALGGASYAATQLARNSVGTKQLKANAVTAAKIKKNAVTAAKIGDGAVSGEKLAGGAVSGDKLADGSVSGGKLADGAITTAKVADGAVTASKIAPGVIPVSRSARLQSGETITGVVTIQLEAAGGGDSLGAAGSFPILPKDPIPAANRHLVTEASAPDCPGVGRADPGQLCVYRTYSQLADSPTLYSETGSQTDPSTYGFTLEVRSASAGSVVYTAVWAYTAP